MAEVFPVKQGDFFECRLRFKYLQINNKFLFFFRITRMGFEIYVNGVRVMEYPYRNGFTDLLNFATIDKARV